MIAYKFLAAGGLSPFTGFRWPEPGEWVRAPPARDDAWVHACRRGDLPYWLDDELWVLELAEPLRETRYQVASPRARLVARITAWDAAVRGEYARACAHRARDVALAHLPAALGAQLARVDDLAAIVAAAGAVDPGLQVARYVADAAENALHVGPATTSYIACILAASIGGGLSAFEAERAWQARWLVNRLRLAPGARA